MIGDLQAHLAPSGYLKLPNVSSIDCYLENETELECIMYGVRAMAPQIIQESDA